jgi:hypothetical protein
VIPYLQRQNNKKKNKKKKSKVMAVCLWQSAVPDVLSHAEPARSAREA